MSCGVSKPPPGSGIARLTRLHVSIALTMNAPTDNREDVLRLAEILERKIWPEERQLKEDLLKVRADLTTEVNQIVNSAPPTSNSTLDEKQVEAAVRSFIEDHGKIVEARRPFRDSVKARLYQHTFLYWKCCVESCDLCMPMTGCHKSSAGLQRSSLMG